MQTRAAFFSFLAGFLIAIIPYLALNAAIYHNPFWPFLEQAYLSGNSGWLNYHGIGYYFAELFRENFLYLLSFIGGILILKNNEAKKEKILPVAIFFLFFIFFNSIRQKEMRFSIILLPYMCLLMSFFICGVYGKLKSNILKSPP